MFNLTLRELNKKADETMFQRDTLEKVLRLGDVLQFMNATIPLKGHLALKGGTAIHLTVFPMLRLSVDIDLDFHATATRDEMLETRKQITDLIGRYMSSQRYQLSGTSKYTHSLDSFIFNYTNLIGNPDNITIEINYSNRSHLFDPILTAIHTPVLNDLSILTVSKFDLFGSKLAALIDRTTPRDLYDVYQMMTMHVFQTDEYSLLKKSALFYISLGIDDLNLTEILASAKKRIAEMGVHDIRRFLIPVLKRGDHFEIQDVSIVVNDFITKLFVLSPNEMNYLIQFNEGNYTPQLLFSDENMINRINNHPMALWKVRQRGSR